MVAFYNIFIGIYLFCLKIAALWNKKAEEWIKGRQNIFIDLEKKISTPDSIIWIHASSAGEFEQAKPVIERIRKDYPGYKILLSFFSPSGYNVSRKYTAADYIFYLPLDTPFHAKRWLNKVNPQLVIFVKYDFWYHYLKGVYVRNIPLLLISSVFRADQLFFKWYGGFYRKMLPYFNWIFVQDESSLLHIKKLGITRSSISGDTRFDRVKEIAENFTEVPYIQEFIGNNRVVVAGSTWQDDEEILLYQIRSLSSDTKLIIAPHEIHPGHIELIQKSFPHSIRYSDLKKGIVPHAPYQTLIIDNVGLLSRLYHYATLTFVGGGFTKDGIHNVLEAAVYGKPVIFGPNYDKYREAKELITAGGGFSVSTAEELTRLSKQLFEDQTAYARSGASSLHYIQSRTGATESILHYIHINRLLIK